MVGFYIGSTRSLGGQQLVATFAVGVVIGAVIAYVIHPTSEYNLYNFKKLQPQKIHTNDKFLGDLFPINDEQVYSDELNSHKVTPYKTKYSQTNDENNEKEDPHEGLDDSSVTIPSFRVPQHSLDQDYHRDENDTVARKLQEEIRIVCLVLTYSTNHYKQAIHVKETWGSRCTQLVFISNKNDSYLEAVSLPNVKEGKEYLWGKTKGMFKYAWDNFRYGAEWFLKTDDDTYVIMENLRLLLSENNPKVPIYHGFRFKPYVKQGYMSGGGGYVLSSEALKRLVTKGIPDGKKCREGNSGAEDVELGKCLEKVGVQAGDSRDSLGRFRFMPFRPEQHLIPDYMPKDFWFWNATYYPQKPGLDCCSDRAITFHFLPANKMYMLEYLLYHVRPYGISQDQSKHVSQKPVSVSVSVTTPASQSKSKPQPQRQLQQPRTTSLKVNARRTATTTRTRTQAKSKTKSHPTVIGKIGTQQIKPKQQSKPKGSKSKSKSQNQSQRQPASPKEKSSNAYTEKDDLINIKSL